jgi:hypothetical protein
MGGASEQPQRGLRQVFWGLFLAFFDVRLANVDMLPDFLGYIILARAFAQLRAAHPAFRVAEWLAIPLIVLSTASLVEWPDMPPELLGASRLLAFADSALDLAMIWMLCDAIGSMARAAGLERLAASADTRRLLYLASVGLGWMLALAAQALVRDPGAAGLGSMAVAIPAAAFGIVVLVLMLLLVRRAARELQPAQPSPSHA